MDPVGVWGRLLRSPFPQTSAGIYGSYPVLLRRGRRAKGSEGRGKKKGSRKEETLCELMCDC